MENRSSGCCFHSLANQEVDETPQLEVAARALRMAWSVLERIIPLNLLKVPRQALGIRISKELIVTSKGFNRFQ